MADGCSNAVCQNRVDGERECNDTITAGNPGLQGVCVDTCRVDILSAKCIGHSLTDGILDGRCQQGVDGQVIDIYGVVV